MLNSSIRAYRPTDKSELLGLMQLNIPLYFDASELINFSSYLDEEIEKYWVIEFEGEIVGCGGINFMNNTTGRLSWDLIHPNYQGKGLGRLLLNFRLKFLEESGCKQVEVRTSQFTSVFYEKNGFKTVLTTPDYWSKGYDLYHMERNLDKLK